MGGARIVVVGLGPAGEDLLAPATLDLLHGPWPVFLRTKVHPAASAARDATTFDHLYETAETFDEVYDQIIEELVAAAQLHGRIVYAVPGSPLVAEATVEKLRERHEIEIELVASLSFIDLVVARLGLDPLRSGIRLVDATDLAGRRLRGPGPLLVAQCHSPAVLSDLKLSIDTDLIDGGGRAIVLHHLGLDDEVVEEVAIDDLDRFKQADHLTSVLVPELRTVGEAAEDLVDLMARLRAECPWDQRQTHGSLARHLLEEAYESLEALESLDAAMTDAEASEEELIAAYGDVAEELGDLIFQVVFHAHLAAEEGRFDLTQVLDGVRIKLIGRHPHVFGDAVADTPDEVAARWEDIKKAEKGRASVTEGIPAALPALTRWTKLRRKAAAIGIEEPSREATLRDARTSLAGIELLIDDSVDDAAATSTGDAADLVATALGAVTDLSRQLGVDSEMALRRRSDSLRDEIIATEESDSSTVPRS